MRTTLNKKMPFIEPLMDVQFCERLFFSCVLKSGAFHVDCGGFCFEKFGFMFGFQYILKGRLRIGHRIDVNVNHLKKKIDFLHGFLI